MMSYFIAKLKILCSDSKRVEQEKLLDKDSKSFFLYYMANKSIVSIPKTRAALQLRLQAMILIVFFISLYRPFILIRLRTCIHSSALLSKANFSATHPQFFQNTVSILSKNCLDQRKLSLIVFQFAFSTRQRAAGCQNSLQAVLGWK